jgi:hypothetical protein
MPKVKLMKKQLANVTATLAAIDVLRLQLIGKKIQISDQLDEMSKERSDKFSQET